jgi:protein-tyrosine-phosphatase
VRQAPALADRIVGAGTHAVAGRAAQESAIRTALAFGVDLSDHQAQPLALAGITATDLVVCMDRANEANVIAALASVRDRVFLVGDVAGASREVLDPFGKGDDATRDAFVQVAQYAAEWLRRFRGRADGGGGG